MNDVDCIHLGRPIGRRFPPKRKTAVTVHACAVYGETDEVRCASCSFKQARHQTAKTATSQKQRRNRRRPFVSSNSGVIYYSYGMNRLCHMLASIATLRNHHDCPVTIMQGDDISPPIIYMTDDKRLNARYELINPITYNGRVNHYGTKTILYRYTPYERTIYLDADTLVVGPIDELWPKRTGEVVLTRYSDWTTRSRCVCRRWERWRDVLGDQIISKLIGHPYPAIQTGAFAFWKGAPFLDAWHDATMRYPAVGRMATYDDETAVHLLLPDWKTWRVLDDRFNCSPKFGVHWDTARIWHGHRHYSTREKMRSGWVAAVEDCWRRNLGNCRVWLHGTIHPRGKEWPYLKHLFA